TRPSATAFRRFARVLGWWKNRESPLQGTFALGTTHKGRRGIVFRHSDGTRRTRLFFPEIRSRTKIANGGMARASRESSRCAGANQAGRSEVDSRRGNAGLA